MTATEVAVISSIPRGVVTEVETDYYTDWKCSVCRQWRQRTYPAIVVARRDGATVQCREHGFEADREEDEECGCHCHEAGVCTECGEESW